MSDSSVSSPQQSEDSSLQDLQDMGDPWTEMSLLKHFDSLIWSTDISCEIKEMLLAAEQAIERNLLHAAERSLKQKTQEHVLNLCYYVTHNRSLDIEALSWLLDHGEKSINITINQITNENPDKIPFPLTAYLTKGSENLPEILPVTLPGRYSPISDASPPPSPIPDVDLWPCYSPVSDTSPSRSPTAEIDLDSLHLSQPDATLSLSQPKEAESNSDEIMLSSAPPNGTDEEHILIPQAQEASASDENLQSSKLLVGDAVDLPEPRQKEQEIVPCILKNELNSIDWWHIHSWVKYYRGGVPFQDEDLIWLIICVAREQLNIYSEQKN